jgi:predicted nucleotidyltransferase
MTASEQIISRLKLCGAELKPRYGIKSLQLFGSVVRGQAGPGSDIDILVEFEEAPTLDGFMALKRGLEDMLARPVDLVTVGALKPRFRELIEKDLVRVA